MIAIKARGNFSTNYNQNEALDGKNKTFLILMKGLFCFWLKRIKFSSFSLIEKTTFFT